MKKLALLLNMDKIKKYIRNTYKIKIKADAIVVEQKKKGLHISMPDSDWLDYFEDLSKGTSDEIMQDIWARILVKEHAENGSVSKAMLNTFAMMDQELALTFQKMCTLTYRLEVDEGKTYCIPLVLYDDILHRILENRAGSTEYIRVKNSLELYQQYLPKQEQLEYLSDINLIKISPVHDESEIYSHSKMHIKYSVGAKEFETDSLQDENYEFVYTGQVRFTHIGWALYNAISNEPYQHLYDVLWEYINFTEEKWYEGGESND
jgi:hypothetical protein